MQHGSQLDQLSAIAMRIYKVKRGEPYRNWTRLRRQNYVAEVRFSCLSVRKIQRALGPMYLSFFAPSAIFLCKWHEGTSWAEPC